MLRRRGEKVATRFFGWFQHTLDDKGRLILPAEFRDSLEAGAYIGRFPDHCLAIYPPGEFDTVTEDITQAAKEGGGDALAASRFFNSGARPIAPDKQGRIPIAQHLREWAQLDRDVVVTGQQKRIELWSPENWRDVEERGQAELARRQGWGI